jgi:hypothetical protein
MGFMIGEIFKVITWHLDHSPNWKRTNTTFYEGYEVVWRHEKWGSIVHSENFKAPGYMSGPAPRHVWRIAGMIGEENWGLTFTHGIAPH